MVREDPTLLSTDLLGWGLPPVLVTMNKNTRVIELLLDLGADVNQVANKCRLSLDQEMGPLSTALGTGNRIS